MPSARASGSSGSTRIPHPCSSAMRAGSAAGFHCGDKRPAGSEDPVDLARDDVAGQPPAEAHDVHVGRPQRVRERLVGLRGEELHVAQPQAAHVGLERRLRRALAHDREHDVAFVTKAVGRSDQRPQRLRQAHVARVHHDEPVVPPLLGAEHRRPLERSHHRAVRPVVDDDDARSGSVELGQASFHVAADGDHTFGPPTERTVQRVEEPNERATPDPPQDDPHLREDVLVHVHERDAPHGAHRRGGHGDHRGVGHRHHDVGARDAHRADQARREVGRVVRQARRHPLAAVERRRPHAGDVHALVTLPGDQAAGAGLVHGVVARPPGDDVDLVVLTQVLAQLGQQPAGC